MCFQSSPKLTSHEFAVDVLSKCGAKELSRKTPH